jgi:hypothetical protein
MLASALQRSLAVLVVVGACGDSGTAGGGADAGGPDAMHNPPNPNGQGPAALVLGGDLTGAGSYVALAKTGITNVTGSSITGGNLGISPATAAAITGFGLSADASNVFSTSSSVVAPGKIYAANYAVPSPTNLTSAILDMQTAYTDAAGRTNPDFLNLGSGNLSGLTLAPGLYRWGTSVSVPTDVTFAGGAEDVWILQISNDLDVSAGKHVLLSGGAQASHIYWQVAGKATLHATSHFEGVILAKTAITLQTTASLHGRMLAQTLVALDNNAISAP